MQKILYFYPIYTSFVQSDYVLLKERYSVRRFHFHAAQKILTPYYLLLQLLFILYHLWSADKFVSQFSGYHSFLPALLGKYFRKPHYIILHGTECNNFPEYNYGYLIRPLLFWFSKKSLAWSSKLLPVSEALVSTEYTYRETRYRMQGFKQFYGNINTPYEVIHNGVAIDQFPIINYSERNPHTFLTVATGLDSANRRAIKGIDLVIELARLTPENNYTFIGASKSPDLDLPVNVIVVEYVPNHELVNYYNKHAFYIQVSASEGFGISVCEAMLCGCVPIVSNVGILPLIAGPKGYVLMTKEVTELVKLVELAKTEYDATKLPGYRDHIVEHFDISLRHLMLFNAI